MSRLDINCYLCKTNYKLIKSHILPKFIGKWLKNTSATGYLRKAVSPNLRIQDLDTESLLCINCEQKFSKWENLFAKKIFYPYVNDHAQEFKYENWLKKFVISVNWRSLLIHLLKWGLPRGSESKIVKTLEDWRLYLMDSPNDGGYDHHIFLADIIVDTSKNAKIPIKIHQYLLRGVDTTIAYNKKGILMHYTKLPYIILASFINPKHRSGWEGTLIDENGVLRTPQQIRDALFGSFLISRAQEALESLEKMSDKQSNDIANIALQNPRRAILSKSYEAFLADQYLRIKQKR